ncbi:MAG: hypothetical protein E7009_03470 [Alphaproteobacteria bacterium]|nr:hypothetical protein [Alphaproteobacteria bacterium]
MRLIVLILCFLPFAASANSLLLDDALRATYTACVGIDDELADLKQMAGINTAITSVGTAAGTGATITGLVKANKDKQISVKLEKLREIEQKNPNIQSTDAEWDKFESGLTAELASAKIEVEKYQAEIEKLNKQSKSLGNWRTGLMAGATATNLAGAIIAGTNQVKGDLETQINNCKQSIQDLRNAMMQARMDGTDISEAQSIVDACGDFEYSDLSKINTRGRGAAISAGVGTATGLAGTITSAMANTDTTRNDNSESGKQKEKKLNTASNILAGTTTAASVTATVFNATQIKAIKQVVEVASKCTGVLK